MSGLIGKWVHILDGEHSRAVGQVILAEGPDHFLVRMTPICDCEDKPPPMAELLAREELCSCAEMNRYVAFFDSEEELRTWVEWMLKHNDDDEPTRVVPMKKSSRKDH